jgi:deoxyribodipyrimidine photolyase-related protein
MSDHCRGCAYDPKAEGTRPPCPMTALYWDFILRHRARWAANPRMGQMLRVWDAMAEGRKAMLRAAAAEVFARLDAGEPV